MRCTEEGVRVRYRICGIFGKCCAFPGFIHRVPPSSNHLRRPFHPSDTVGPQAYVLFQPHREVTAVVHLLTSLSGRGQCFSQVPLLGALSKAVMASGHENFKTLLFLNEPAYSLLLLAAWSLSQAAGWEPGNPCCYMPFEVTPQVKESSLGVRLECQLPECQGRVV